MILLLHNIRSAHNVGSMFRTADALGIEKIYLTGYTPGPKDRYGKIRKPFAKVSLGAEAWIPYISVKSPGKLLASLRSQGHSVVAIEQSAKSVPYDRVKFSKQDQKKIVLMMGNEVRGISPALLRYADSILEIPMHGKKESLNVSVAFGIVGFSLLRAKI